MLKVRKVLIFVWLLGSFCFNFGGIFFTPQQEINKEVEIEDYVVRQGDTLATVAERYGVDIDTLRALNLNRDLGVNNFKGITKLVPGMVIQVVHRKGIFYKVREGQTLGDLSVIFSVSVVDILEANGIKKPERLQQDTIFIPDAKPLDQYSRRVLIKLGNSVRPTLARPLKGILRVNSGFGYRTHPLTGRRERHSGVDLKAYEGTPIYAVKDGVVQFAGVRGGYGNLVILKHKGGLSTFYGHTLQFCVSHGKKVKKGEKIALVGTTGSSTGAHLHFEVRKHDKPVSPYGYLSGYKATKLKDKKAGAAIGGDNKQSEKSSKKIKK